MRRLGWYKLGGRGVLRAIASALWETLEFIRRPLPTDPVRRSAIVLAFVLMPFLSIEWITVESARRVLAWLLIALAILGVGDRIIASLQIARLGRLSIRAKQFGLGRDYFDELQVFGRRTWGLPLLFFILAGVACSFVVAISSVTWSVVHHHGYSGPFRTLDPGRLDVLLYFSDEAARGLTFRLLADLAIAVPDKLEPVGALWFTLLTWAYKAAITLLTVQVGWLWITSIFTELDPEVQRWRRMRDDNMRFIRKAIFARQERRGGLLSATDERTLKEQFETYRHTYDEGDPFADIKRAFGWHNKAKGRKLKRRKKEENRLEAPYRAEA